MKLRVTKTLLMSNVNEVNIKTSFDYSRFKFYPSNREPNHWRKLYNSIKENDLTKYVPIVVQNVDGFLYIVDGQGRFLACKELGIPIYYIESTNGEIGDKDIATMNTNQTSWRLIDYLEYYKSKGLIDYVRFYSIYKELGDFNINHMLKSLGKLDSGSYRKFRDGELNYDKDDMIHHRKVFNAIQSFLDNGLNFRITSVFVGALSVVLKCVSLNELIQQHKKYPSLLTKQVDKNGYIEMLESLLNYRKRPVNRVYFKDNRIARYV